MTVNDHTIQLLAVLGLVDSIRQVLCRLLDDTDAPVSDSARRMVAAAAMHAERHRPRTKADVLRFTEAVQQGDEGWLVLRSVPGEFRTEGIYLTSMAKDTQRAIGLR